ncbi:MAG: hypothetical protein ACI823_002578, partial [Chitinophagales bacterium]
MNIIFTYYKVKGKYSWQEIRFNFRRELVCPNS